MLFLCPFNKLIRRNAPCWLQSGHIWKYLLPHFFCYCLVSSIIFKIILHKRWAGLPTKIRGRYENMLNSYLVSRYLLHWSFFFFFVLNVYCLLGCENYPELHHIFSKVEFLQRPAQGDPIPTHEIPPAWFALLTGTSPISWAKWLRMSSRFLCPMHWSLYIKILYK